MIDGVLKRVQGIQCPKVTRHSNDRHGTVGLGGLVGDFGLRWMVPVFLMLHHQVGIGASKPKRRQPSPFNLIVPGSGNVDNLGV